MVGSDPEFRFLNESAKRFVGLLARSLFEAPRRDHRGSALSRHIEATAKGVLAKLDETADEYRAAADDRDRDAAITKARLLGSYARFMHRSLPWLEDARRSPLDLGALYFVDELAVRLLGERADVVPTRSDEYSTERWPFEPIFPALGLTVGDGPVPIIINVPALELRTYLLLPLFAHELGHTVVWRGDLLSKALAPLRASSGYDKRFEAARDDFAAKSSFSQQRARLVINQRLEYWIEELLCDQIALQHLGPSFLLAFATYVISLGWNEPGERHPPATLRVAHLNRWLHRVGWESHLQSKLPTIASWLSAVGQTSRQAGQGEALTFILDTLDGVCDDLADEVSAALGDEVYVPGAFEAEERTIAELLEFEILPVQDSRTRAAFDRRAIMYSSWLSIITEVGEAVENLPRALEQVESQEFFTKALEMSCLLHNWSDC